MESKRSKIYDILKEYSVNILEDEVKTDFDFELLGLSCVFCSNMHKTDNYSSALHYTEKYFGKVNSLFYKSNLHVIDTWRRELICLLVEECGLEKGFDLSDDVTRVFREF